jgi:flagellar hook protein FlgE
MNRAAGSFDVAAAQIARMGQSPGNAPGASTSAAPQGDTVDLASSMISVLNARNNFEANTKAVVISEKMTQATLNMIG